MEIHGLQKLTLLDYPGHVACTVFMGGCNLRCPFCHNSELIDCGAVPPVMDDGELLSFLKKRQGILEGVCITGGEPLLRSDLQALLRKIKELGYPVKLDTNGTRFEDLRSMLTEGLVDYVAMDIKNDPARYARTCGLADMDMTSVFRSIGLLLKCDTEYELRTTVVEELHDEDSFLGIGQMISGAKKYFLQPFIDRDTVQFAGLHAPSQEKMQKYLEIVTPFVKAAEIRGIE